MLPNWLVRAWSMYGFVHGQAMPDSHSLHINQGRAMPHSISPPTLKSQVGQCLTHRFDTHALGFGMWPLVIGLLQTGLIQHASPTVPMATMTVRSRIMNQRHTLGHESMPTSSRIASSLTSSSLGPSLSHLMHARNGTGTHLAVDTAAKGIWRLTPLLHTRRLKPRAIT